MAFPLHKGGGEKSEGKGCPPWGSNREPSESGVCSTGRKAQKKPKTVRTKGGEKNF